MYVNLIVSIDNDRCIGYDNNLLYDIEEDKKYFSDITKGNYYKKEIMNIVVMGRKTWESIPDKYKPLKNRINIIISSKLSGLEQDNTFIYPNFKSFIDQVSYNNGISHFVDNKFNKTHNINEIYVIGGSKLYNEVLNNYEVNKIYLTDIQDKHKTKKNLCNKVYFPDLDQDKYYLTSESKIVTKNYSTGYYEDTKSIVCNFKILQNKSLVQNEIQDELMDYFKTNYLNQEEYQYLDIMEDLMENGDKRETRNAITYSKFGVKMEFDLKDNTIPILTTKRVACKTVIKELLWFIKGSTNNKTLQDQNVHIWDGNSSRDFLDQNGFKEREENELGPIYGFQWRHSGAEYKTCHDNYEGQGVDQLQECINTLKKNPHSRRMIVCAWNPKDLNNMALPPCHILFQWYVSSDKRLSLQLYQRSGDFFLGVPFNIMSYSVLIYMVAQLTGLRPGKFIHIIGDAHAYECHGDAIEEQIKRIPSQFPKFKINRQVESIEDFKLEDFEIIDYNPHDTIKAQMVA
jgi:dihydrofolate reductase/thymidylate synthase